MDTNAKFDFRCIEFFAQRNETLVMAGDNKALLSMIPEEHTGAWRGDIVTVSFEDGGRRPVDLDTRARRPLVELLRRSIVVGYLEGK